MNKQRIAILISALLGFSAAFMPWLSVNMGIFSKSSSGFEQVFGFLTILLFIPAIIFSLVGDRSQSISGKKIYGSIIPSLLSSVLAIIFIVFISSQPESAIASFGIGVYLTLLSPLALTVLTFILKDREIQ